MCYHKLFLRFWHSFGIQDERIQHDADPHLGELILAILQVVHGAEPKTQSSALRASFFLNSEVSRRLGKMMADWVTELCS